jgi:DNA-binding IclR family transcriptional regulator
VGDDENSTSSGIDRALRVIYEVAASNEPDVGVSELARSLGLSKAVVHRVVRTLVAADFFSFDEKLRRYRLGPGAVSVGLAALAQIEVPKVAQPFLERLVEETAETATLSARYGDKRMYLSQVLSPQEIRMSVQLGRLYPLHAGGSSKAILAALDVEQQRRYVHSAPLDALTGVTITDPDELLRELAEISRRGFAVSLGERQSGAASVAAAIHDATGQVQGSISVCGPVNRIDSVKIDDFGPLVAEAARSISRQLGYRGQ